MLANPKCGRVREKESYLYGSCPICGKKLCRANSGSNVEVVCPTCKKTVSVEVLNGRVISVITEEPVNLKPASGN